MRIKIIEDYYYNSNKRMIEVRKGIFNRLFAYVKHEENVESPLMSKSLFFEDGKLVESFYGATSFGVIELFVRLRYPGSQVEYVKSKRKMIEVTPDLKKDMSKIFLNSFEKVREEKEFKKEFGDNRIK